MGGMEKLHNPIIINDTVFLCCEVDEYANQTVLMYCMFCVFIHNLLMIYSLTSKLCNIPVLWCSITNRTAVASLWVYGVFNKDFDVQNSEAIKKNFAEETYEQTGRKNVLLYGSVNSTHALNHISRAFADSQHLTILLKQIPKKRKRAQKHGSKKTKQI